MLTRRTDCAASGSGERFRLTQSAAILIYLAERMGRLIRKSLEAGARVFEQLFFRFSGIGPAFG